MDLVIKSQDTLKKVFISHSSIDKDYIEKVIDILELIGVHSSDIFCSSFEGYGIKLGENFLDRIKDELNNEVLVVFILSKNFYNSPISLCEMGATWIKTNYHVPILIPPFDYKDIKGVIPQSHAMKINESEKYNNLKDLIEHKFNLKTMNSSIWERKRNKILAEINLIIKPEYESALTFLLRKAKE